MSEEQINILELFEERLGSGRNSKISRFLLNCLSSTPFVGGVFSATASAWVEADQQGINELVAQLATLTDERITSLENELVKADNPKHVVAGYITFNPNSASTIGSSNITTLGDLGTLDFDISFRTVFENYIFNYYGSGKVVLKEVHEMPDGIRVLFEEPCPDRVTIVFFEQQTNSQMKADG